MQPRSYSEVDVFSAVPYRGNPLAIVHDADGLTTDEMQRFAKWTNLSETTFLLPPTSPEADYRVRIFSTVEEFPFAGHPTLGSARAWLAAGGVPRRDGVIVQECDAGLVPVRVSGSHLAFQAPPLTRYEPVDDQLRHRIAAALGIRHDAILAASWLVNGPEWIGVRLASAVDVLALTPSPADVGALNLGVVGPHPADAEAQFEVRAFLGDDQVFEDPVTGSLNAGLARWLYDTGVVSGGYLAAQGTVLGRAGRVHVTIDETGADALEPTIWVGGAAQVCVRGEVTL